MEEVTTQAAFNILNYGALGAMVVLFLAAIIILWRHLQKQQKENRVEMRSITTEFLSRTDRYNEVMEQNNLTSQKQNEVLTEMKHLLNTTNLNILEMKIRNNN